MDLIKNGLGLGRTIRNVGRIREILTVFARNGLAEFVERLNLSELVPDFVFPQRKLKTLEKTGQKEDRDWWTAVGHRLRLSFEELGPSFIKIGQLLASRENLLNPHLLVELKKLQNRVSPPKWSVSQKLIERELGQKIDAVFSNVEKKPLGSASIGTVYRAELINGKRVVLKVKRSGIDEVLRNDFEIIHLICLQLEKLFSELHYLGLSRAIHDFYQNILLELDFFLEANNAKRLGKNLLKKDSEQIFVVPAVFEEYSGRSLLVMEFLEGPTFYEVAQQGPLSAELEKKLIDGVKLFLQTLLIDGFFHADLHAGNFLLLEDNKIGLIDFGLMGHLSGPNRLSLIAILYALTTYDYENLVYEFLDIAEYKTIPQSDELVRDLREGLAGCVGLNNQQIQVTQVFGKIIRILSAHRIYLPREWYIIFRSLMTLDGLGKGLRIQLNLFEILAQEIPPLLPQIFSKEKVIENSLWLGRDLLSSFRMVPRHLRWFLKHLSKKNYAFSFRIEGLQTSTQNLSDGLVFIGLCLVSSVLFYGGLVFVERELPSSLKNYPTPTLIFWCLSLILFIAGPVGWWRRKL